MFQFYNMWLSLLGSLLCVAVMFLISWWTALITLGVLLTLYLIVAYSKPGMEIKNRDKVLVACSQLFVQNGNASKASTILY